MADLSGSERKTEILMQLAEIREGLEQRHGNDLTSRNWNGMLELYENTEIIWNAKLTYTCSR